MIDEIIIFSIVSHNENDLDPEVDGETNVEPNGDPFVMPRDDQ